MIATLAAISNVVLATVLVYAELLTSVTYSSGGITSERIHKAVSTTRSRDIKKQIGFYLKLFLRIC